MFELEFDEIEYYDNVKEEFITIPKRIFKFNFTLLALDKWESKHRKRLLDNPDITTSEMLDFFNIMCEEELPLERVSVKEFEALSAYMNDTPSATKIPPSRKKTGQRKTIFTSEIIYAYMALSGIPFDWESKNLNKLLQLVNTISSLQSPPEKMSKEESMAEHERLIMERRAQLNKME